jgi:hypothetical protein
MILALALLGAAVLLAACFYAGMLHGSRAWLRTSARKLASPLRLQASPGWEGSLPAGTIVYPYRSVPDTTTYLVFFNLKERDVLDLTWRADEPYLVAPLDAVPEEGPPAARGS